jgi:hypothetical protein
MSRNLKRVSSDFAWPLKKVWGGYLNPYWKLSTECPDCNLGHDRTGGRPNANAALFYEQWYGHTPFDPIAYGAEPLSPDSPAIWDRARHNIASAPDFYMTPSEHAARRANLQKAGVDLMELYKTNEELKAELDAPAGELETLEQPGIVKIESFREPAIKREAARLHALWCDQWCHHLIQADVDALVEGGRLPDFTHRPRSPEQAALLEEQAAAGGSRYWLAEPNGYHPTAGEVNAWSLGGLAHDATNSHVCIEARCVREGVPFMCARCKGSGKIWPTPAIKQQCDDWRRTDPPAGDGYQLWEDCSEGSPVSPVFTSLDELCAWAADHATTFASFTATVEEWKEMLDGGIVHHSEGDNVFL